MRSKPSVLENLLTEHDFKLTSHDRRQGAGKLQLWSPVGGFTGWFTETEAEAFMSRYHAESLARKASVQAEKDADLRRQRAWNAQLDAYTAAGDWVRASMMDR